MSESKTNPELIISLFLIFYYTTKIATYSSARF